MRAPAILSSKWFIHRLFCCTLAIFVGLQMYATIWQGIGAKTPNHVHDSSIRLGIASMFSPKKQHTETSNRFRDHDTGHAILRLNVSEDKDNALRVLRRLNSEQFIRNNGKFNLQIRHTTVVLLIQVHKRKEDLATMIASLSRVRYINQSLVVFSHDYYSRDIFQLIHSVDFCPVLQLFYPFSIQFFADRFPGTGPDDCPRDIGQTKALRLGCYNAKYPDAFGHYRESTYTQMKHHWTWKLHFVFDRVHILKDFPGTVLRLDNDYYLAEDAIHVIRLLDDIKPIKCPDCLMYILGEYEQVKNETYEHEGNTGKAISAYWFTGIGRGMAIKLDFWKKFKSCAAWFCRFDDYNWDWAMEHSTSQCFKGLKVLKPSAGRIFHIGMCHGFHRNVMDCDTKKVIRDLENVLYYRKNKLYPKIFQVRESKIRFRTNTQPNGGWADPRDHELCMHFFNNGTDDDGSLMNINKIHEMAMSTYNKDSVMRDFLR